ncbi:hypothetical protein SDRG_09819 [Saprolegnia diclina VS20]|uniref:Uncharacterized protein n=1 Tax=Saprolegnia diclina (strain VS20) TaxID=1156394 RepID=T0RJT6_SAPDV|nr:hypothetical protein SDRG_09819 [Saprolegnia diclina VS20]EQC32493.1 hypothetical protein SDRG_09819 [Saprolegnia diclina VS20]|eukprot:XP_008613994.1 hypothetical protein SDRG_09819 [Saprolegnia diclina VS20]
MESSQQLWTLAVVATGAAFAPADDTVALALAGLAVPIPIVLTQAATRIWVRRSAAVALLGCMLSALSCIALPYILASIVNEQQRAVLDDYCPVVAIAAPALVVLAVLSDRVAARRRQAWLAVITAAVNTGIYYYLFATRGARASAWPIVATTYAHALCLGALSWSLESRPTADDEGTKNRPTQAFAAIAPWLLAVVLASSPAPALATSFLAYVGLGLEFGAGVARSYGCHRVGIVVVASALVALTVVYGVPWTTAVNAIDRMVVLAFALASLATVVGPPVSPASTVGGAVVFLVGVAVVARLAPDSALAVWVLQALVQGAKCALGCIRRQAPTYTQQETVHLLSGRPAIDHGATTASTKGNDGGKDKAPTQATSDASQHGWKNMRAQWCPCCHSRRPQSYKQQQVVLSTDEDGLAMYERHRVSPTLHDAQERAGLVLGAQSTRLLEAGNASQPSTARPAVDNLDQDRLSVCHSTHHDGWRATSPTADSVQDRASGHADASLLLRQERLRMTIDKPPNPVEFSPATVVNYGCILVRSCLCPALDAPHSFSARSIGVVLALLWRLGELV